MVWKENKKINIERKEELRRRKVSQSEREKEAEAFK